MRLTTKICRPIANIGDFIESEHVRYWKKFHRFNANSLNKLTSTAPICTIEKSEIETRILKILFESELAGIKHFSFQHDIRKDLYLDSLSVTVLISSIEQEFSTIFDDDVFDDVKTLGEVVEILAQDDTIL